MCTDLILPRCYCGTDSVPKIRPYQNFLAMNCIGSENFLLCKETAQKGFIPGYASTIADAECKQRYAEKLKLLNGHDPYELPREEWKDNIDMWPAITYVHVCMYLILYPSPYTNDDMLNYKSLDSFQNFQNGWVREVLVKEVGERKIIIGKVSYYIHCM